jgi:hypothetical protein
MIQILVSMFIVMIVIAIAGINYYRVKFKNCKDALKKEEQLVKDHNRKINELKRVLDTVLYITESKTVMKDDDFPFIAVNTDNISRISLTSIKFTKKDDKVIKHINGIIKPFDGLICFNETYLESSIKKDLLTIREKYRL